MCTKNLEHIFDELISNNKLKVPVFQKSEHSWKKLIIVKTQKTFKLVERSWKKHKKSLLEKKKNISRKGQNYK